MKPILIAAVVAVAAAAHSATAAVELAKPNIIVILADDLGYGDVQCLNPKRGKIKTPNLDKLAAQGMTFTDMHASAAQCTPSRYSLLTGRFCWRTRLQKYVLGHYDAPLIAADRLTLPSLLRQSGYQTAAVGKWHLGWTWPRVGKEDQMDFAQPIKDGPTSRGFDSFFGLDAPNFPPFCFIENDRTVVVPSVPLPEKMRVDPRVLPHFPNRHGPMAPGWTYEAILPAITGKACERVRQLAKSDRPYFLYFALTSPHTPLSPNREWLGKSGLGLYGDFVMETDAMVGRVLDAVAQSGEVDNTLVIFTSDNGCANYIGVEGMNAKGHFPSAGLRGYKVDIWDGGHRVPFIARWPVVIKPGSSSNRLLCLADLTATCAELINAKLPDNAAEDSFSFLPLLRGQDRPVHESLVNHSGGGRFAIREGDWKLILGPGAGGMSHPSDAEAIKQGLPKIQLYNLMSDLAEQKNLQAEHPEIVQRLTAKLTQIVANGRSTPGPKQKNDVPVNIVK